ncbi:hypothetical protein ACFV9E_17155 [Streptomyces sp. NPDC059835]|uniref:hypothetical protein n=1 Tax=Streptomyces sp. NPDC059835 TaxID=3346967 RepID=UPI00364A5F22
MGGGEATMNGVAAPPIWFRLPPGFHDIGPRDRAALDDVAHALGSPAAARDIAHLMEMMGVLHAHGVVHTAIGLHPDDLTGVATSLFSLTIRQAEHDNPRVSVSQTALAIARSALWTSSTRRMIELPSSLPCFLVAGFISSAETADHMFQARIATTDSQGHYVIILDLTSAATQYADDYTSILEAVSHTVSFSDPDPEPSPPGATRPSRILEVLL